MKMVFTFIICPYDLNYLGRVAKSCYQHPHGVPPNDDTRSDQIKVNKFRLKIKHFFYY